MTHFSEVYPALAAAEDIIDDLHGVNCQLGFGTDGPDTRVLRVTIVDNLMRDVMAALDPVADDITVEVSGVDNNGMLDVVLREEADR